MHDHSPNKVRTGQSITVVVRSANLRFDRGAINDYTAGTGAALRYAPGARVAQVILTALLAASGLVHAAEPLPADDANVVVREIYVPTEDLEVLLEGQPRRVLLTREEYEELLEKAVQRAEESPPRDIVAVALDTTITVQRERAQLLTKLTIEALDEGLLAVPLDIAGVGLRRATLDGKAAAIGKTDDGRMALFLEGVGLHELLLEMVAPLETTAARQQLAFRLPEAATRRLRLTVPGDVEIKSGASVISRVVDESAGLTRFDLLTPRGDVQLVMTLNSHLARLRRAVVARSVIVDEVTEAYERLHATVSMVVLSQAVDQFRFVVPEGFEVTDVQSPLLASWAMEAESDQGRVLDVRLREPTTETVLLNLSAVRMAPRAEAWTMPRITPLDVVAQVAVVGLLVDERLSTESIESSGLIPIDVDVLRAAIPETVFQAEPGAPTLRPIVAWYAPQEAFQVSARFVRPPAKTVVTTNVLLILRDKGLQVHGGFLLQPEVEKLFDVEFSVPADWSVTSVSGSEGPLAFDRHGEVDEDSRIRVKLPKGINPGEEYRLFFEAASTPRGWLTGQDVIALEFPVFATLGVTDDVGAIAVDARDDMVVRPESLQRLAPLDETEKERYLPGVKTNLAYRYESRPYRALLSVHRTQPRVTARTYSFIRVRPDSLAANYEVVYQVEEARARSLSLLLPDDTPEALSIRGLDGVAIKEFVSDPAEDGWRRWNVSLAEPRRGVIRLAVEFQQPLAAERRKDFPAPVIRADGVAWQSGLIAVEGTAERHVSVTPNEKTRRVDVGELVDAQYRAGRRLLGAFGFTGTSGGVRIEVEEHPGYGLYSTIVQRAELATRISADGKSETAALFQLRTNATYLEVQLPPNAKLWSADVNGRPLSPQRDGEKLLVALPGSAAGSAVSLRLCYQTPLAAIGASGRVEVSAPRLFLRGDDEDQAVEVPMADLVWRLHPPAGYDVAHSSGTVSRQVSRGEPAVVTVVKAALGTLFFSPLTGYSAHTNWRDSVGASRATLEMKDGQRLPSPYYMGDDVQYWDAEDEKSLDFRISNIHDSYAEHGGEEGMEYDAEMVDDSESMTTDEPAPAEEPPPVVEPAEAMPGDDDPFEDPFGERPVDAQPATPALAGAQPESAESPQGRMADFDSLIDLIVATIEPMPFAPKRRLEGFRSLLIELEQGPSGDEDVAVFESLGSRPTLVVTLSNRPRRHWAGWAIALAVGLVGVAITRRRAKSKVHYLAAVIAIGTIIPLVPFSFVAGTLQASNMAVYAAGLLIPYFLLAGMVRVIPRGACRCWTARRKAAKLVAEKRAAKNAASNTTDKTADKSDDKSDDNSGEAPSRTPFGPAKPLALLLAAVLSLNTARAAEPPINLEDLAGRLVVEVAGPPASVAIPQDAVVLPYDAESQTGIRDANRIMVPYAKYEELWNRAYPDQRLTAERPPTDYALSGVSYNTLLVGDDYLSVTGRLLIEVFVDEPLAVPLGLSGGVLTLAELDGRQARLSVPLVAQAPQQQPQQAQQKAEPPQPAGAIVLLHLQGRGRHELELAIRMRLERRGGWRVARGVIPSAPAGDLVIGVPESQTEVVVGQVADRRSYETQNPNESIETALAPNGGLEIQWRPKVAEGQVDQSLTAESDAVLDVQEDGLRLVWKLNLRFRRGEYETFQVDVPAGYLLEKVEGPNVRGWKVDDTEDGQPNGDGRRTVDVSLLNTARDGEQITLRLWRAGPVGSETMAEFDAPVVRARNASLESGRLTIRRSPLLDVRVIERQGVSRTDLSSDGANQAAGGVGEEESPLGIRPFQAFRFASTRYKLRLAASPVVGRVKADVYSVLRIAEYERGFESRIVLNVRDRPVHRVEILLPEGLELDDVSAPGEFQWALTDRQGRTLLTVYLAAGSQGSLAVRIEGTLADGASDEAAGVELPLPNLQVLGVDEQQGHLAIQADPVYDVVVKDLVNCENVLLDQVFPWLNPGQREVTRQAVRYREADYQGVVALSPRQPDVTCDAISNVRVTDRAVEETILLTYDIRSAGADQLVFLLPDWMSDCRIHAPMLREKTIEPAGDETPGMVRVTLDLQDEIMGEFRVLVDNDRLLEPETDYRVPIAVVLPGDSFDEFTVRRFVALESAGRDEVIVNPEDLVGVKPLHRQQAEWDRLRVSLGGGNITQAYLVSVDDASASMTFRTRRRTALEMTKARIGLAEATLVFDESGAYRAQQLYWIDNRTEQFLEIELPGASDGHARLWTAQQFSVQEWRQRAGGESVVGEPLKPTVAPNAKNLRRVRIPLVKTAVGDLDYVVRLTYGGNVDSLNQTLGQVSFPLIESVNLHVEQSQLRLYLPEAYHWYKFKGMTQVDQEDLIANQTAYETKKWESLVDVMRHGDVFDQIRAINNTMVFAKLQAIDSSRRGKYAKNARLDEELSRNYKAIEEANKQAVQVRHSLIQEDGTGNRFQMFGQYEQQDNTRARNVVHELGSNWGGEMPEKAPDQASAGFRFNSGWLDNNSLLNAKALDKKEAEEASSESQRGETKSRLAVGKKRAPPAQRERYQNPGFANQAADAGRQSGERSSGRAGMEGIGGGMGGMGVGGGQHPGYVLRLGQAQQQRDVVTRYQQEDLRRKLAESQSTLGGMVGQDRSVTVGMQAPGVFSADLTIPGASDEQIQVWGRRLEDARRGGQLAGEGRPVGGVAFSPNGKALDLALHNYHDTYAAFPGGAVAADGTVIASNQLAAAVENFESAHGRFPGYRFALTPPSAAGLASRDVDIPLRGTRYCFSTPGGDVEITARAVPKSLLTDGRLVGCLAGGLIVVLLFVRLVCRGRFNWLTGRSGSIGLIIVGVLSFCLFPVLGLLMFGGGLTALAARATLSPQESA